jgi:hypothetical protein
MKKIVIITVLLSLVGAAIMVGNPAKSRVKPYYSGEAASYNGNVYVGTVNSGSFELFALENGNLYRKTSIQSQDRESKEFADLLFWKESGKLFVFLTNGRYLYKYDISNPIVPKEVAKLKDNSWDWFLRLDVKDGKLVTIGSKGVKVWNKDLIVVDAYNMIDNHDLGSASFSDKGDLAINMQNDKLKIYNTVSRKEVAEYSIASNDSKAVRQAVGVSDEGLIYLVDDKALKAVGLDGQVKKELKHISNAGYDVADSVNPDYIYFSDGMGVVKVDRDSFKASKWAYSYADTPTGSWAMGLDVVADGASEKVVVFNGSNIWVLDSNLKTVAYYESQEEDYRPIEDLSLSIDKNRAAANTQVSLIGQGFGVEEDLKIEFAGFKQAAIKADKNGRFKTILTVPSVLPGGADIKVTGQSSKRTYSIAFKIE